MLQGFNDEWWYQVARLCASVATAGGAVKFFDTPYGPLHIEWSVLTRLANLQVELTSEAATAVMILQELLGSLLLGVNVLDFQETRDTGGHGRTERLRAVNLTSHCEPGEDFQWAVLIYDERIHTGTTKVSHLMSNENSPQWTIETRATHWWKSSVTDPHAWPFPTCFCREILLPFPVECACDVHVVYDVNVVCV